MFWGRGSCMGTIFFGFLLVETVVASTTYIVGDSQGWGFSVSYTNWVKGKSFAAGDTLGKHLAEICRSEYPKYVKYCLWILAELSIIAANIPEAYVKPKASDIFEGMFVPKLKGNGATGDAVALFGALIMPHNLFLHSALVLSRKVPQSVHGINSACKFFLWEAGFTLFVAFWINVAMISVTASVCSVDNLSQANQDRCNNLTLDNESFLLKNSLGKAS